MAGKEKIRNRDKVPEGINPIIFPGLRLVHKDKVDKRESMGYIRVPGSIDGVNTVKMFKPAKKE